MRRKQRKPRDWNAISAHFRNSAGAMKSSRKEEDKYACRDFDMREALDKVDSECVHEEEVLAHWCEAMNPEAFWGEDETECYCSRIKKSGSE